jgi:hypothetical protein
LCFRKIVDMCGWCGKPILDILKEPPGCVCKSGIS